MTTLERRGMVILVNDTTQDAKNAEVSVAARVFNVSSTVFVYLLAACILIGAVLFAFDASPTKSIFGYRYYTILTPSMSPSYEVGDVVFVHIDNLLVDTEACCSQRVSDADALTFVTGTGPGTAEDSLHAPAAQQGDGLFGGNIQRQSAVFILQEGDTFFRGTAGNVFGDFVRGFRGGGILVIISGIPVFRAFLGFDLHLAAADVCVKDAREGGIRGDVQDDHDDRQERDDRDRYTADAVFLPGFFRLVSRFGHKVMASFVNRWPNLNRQAGGVQ